MGAKTMKNKIIRAIALALATLTVFAFCGCKNKNAEYTSWEVRVYNDGEGNADVQYVDFSVTRNSKNIKAVWINVAKISASEVQIDFAKVNGDSKKTLTLDKKTVKNAIKNDGGWIKAVDDWKYGLSTVRMSLKGNVTINEVAFVGEGDKKLSVSVSKAYIYYVDKDGKIQGSQEAYTKSELEGITGSKVGLPLNLVDEQDKFDKVKNED